MDNYFFPTGFWDEKKRPEDRYNIGRLKKANKNPTTFHSGSLQWGGVRRKADGWIGETGLQFGPFTPSGPLEAPFSSVAGTFTGSLPNLERDPTYIPTSPSVYFSFPIMPEQLFLGGVVSLFGLIYSPPPVKGLVLLGLLWQIAHIWLRICCM